MTEAILPDDLGQVIKIMAHDGWCHGLQRNNDRSLNEQKKTTMAYYSRTLNIPFEEALTRVTQNLQRHGFGIITTIDLQDTFKQKLQVGFRKYKILGACNPSFAYKAISLESHMGILLPCNVVVQEHENGQVEVSAINPLDSLDAALNTTQLVDLAADIGLQLRSAVDELQPTK